MIQSPQKTWPYPHLDFRLLDDSRNTREYISVVLSYLVMAALGH